MKEAAGEANMTVITIILIGVIAAIAIPLVNSAMKSTAKKTCCQNAGGVYENNACKNPVTNGAIGDYWDDANNKCND